MPSTNISVGNDMSATFMTPTGLFISFEGIDGAGKSTHIAVLAQAFEAQGRAVTLSREPGGTPLAEKLRTLVLHDAMDAMTEALLVFAARRDHLQQLIAPALARAEVVLCDRFTDATFAYQGSGRGFDLSTLQYLEQLVQTVQGPEGDFILQPDLTLWFDLAPLVAAQRLADTRLPDRFESQPVDFFTRVRAGYLQRFEQQPQRFARIDADQPLQAVWQSVLQAVRQRGWLA
jgi:dTMP kinase